MSCCRKKPWYKHLYTWISGAITLTVGILSLIVLSRDVRRNGVLQSPVKGISPNGWDAKAAKSAWQDDSIRSHFQAFKLKGAAASGAGKKSLLWEPARLANNGVDVERLVQEIGDCVVHGWAHGWMYQAAFRIAVQGLNEELIVPARQYSYSYARVIVGKNQIRGPDGAVGAWMFVSMQEGGIVDSKTEGFPAYNAQSQRQWATRKPDSKWIELGRKHKTLSAAQIKTYNEARESISNGFPVPVCSDQGFSEASQDDIENGNDEVIAKFFFGNFGRVSEGKRYGIPRGNWNHCMCFIGVDDTCTPPSWAGNRSGRKGALYCLNSWPKGMMGSPESGEPEGGFWVAADVAERMLSQDDSFGVAIGDGFEAAPPDWNFSAAKKLRDLTARQSAFAVSL